MRVRIVARRACLAAPRLGNEARLEKQFVALQHELLVPRPPVEAEGDRGALQPVVPKVGIGRRLDPVAQPRLQPLLDDGGRAEAMILPGKIGIPARPARFIFAGGRLLAGQAKIADRDDLLAGAGAVLVGEGVELLDIAERQPGLPLDPGAQARLQRAMFDLERPRRQRALVLNGQDARIAVGHRDEHGDEVRGDAGLQAHRHGAPAAGTNRPRRTRSRHSALS